MSAPPQQPMDVDPPVEATAPAAPVEAAVPAAPVEAAVPAAPVEAAAPAAPVEAAPPGRVLRTRAAPVSYFPKSKRKTYGAPAPRKQISTRRPAQKRQREPSIEINPVGVVNSTKMVNFFRILQEGERIGPGHWCCACRNGGTMALCEIQNCRNAFCSSCIVPDPHISFICPRCHVSINDKQPTPYPHILLNPPSTRENLPTIQTEPLAIISLHISGLKSNDTPATIVYHQLLPWLDGNLVLLDLDFDLFHHQGDFEDRMDALVDLFVTGNLTEWKRFLIFITTHSEPNEGLLHMGPNEIGAVSVSELFSVLIPPRMRTLLQQSKSNFLGLLSCGAVSTTPEAKAELQKFADLDLFEKILTFTQPDFQPTLTFPFFQNIIENHFIYGRQNLQYHLPAHSGLGAHSGIVQLQKDVNKTYIWTHRAKRPMGKSLTQQCPICHHLRPWKLNKDSSTDKITVLQCMRCSTGEFKAKRPDNSNWLKRGDDQTDPLGAWYVIEERNGQTGNM